MAEKITLGPELWEKVISSLIVKKTLSLLKQIFKREFRFYDLIKMGITPANTKHLPGGFDKPLSIPFPFCELINTTKIGVERCMHQADKANQIISTTGQIYLHLCHAGLTEMAVPIMLQNNYCGCISIVGGLLLHTPNETEWSRIVQQVKDTGVDLEQLRQAYFQITPISQELLEVMLKLLSVLIEEIAKTTSAMALDKKRISELENALMEKYRFANIIGQSKTIREIFRLLDQIKDTDDSVLIQGETGTGKELIAQAIHYNSPRKDKPLIVQNCAALNEPLLESELFGHVKGAFTGAISDKRGLFELSNHGTLFLDEIGEMSPGMQAKLLRAIEQGEIRRVGAEKVIPVDVRIISATNKDLRTLIQEDNFRKDLYYRLLGIQINLPPLRERKEDIPLLVEYFLKVNQEKSGKELKIASESLRLLINYDWPGNIRQLEMEIKRAITLAKSQRIITPELFSSEIRKSVRLNQSFGVQIQDKSFQEAVERLEKELLLSALEQTNWNKTKTAQLLKIPSSTLYNKIQQYKLAKRYK